MSDSKKLKLENNDQTFQADLHTQQFIRNVAFFGNEGQQRIENASVTIVGLGGVGSNAAHMLARSGVGHLTFIDFDVVTISSLNRHAVATRKDIGVPKVEVMKNHILDFNPDAMIETHNTLLSKDNIESLLSNRPDFVVDCIDDYTTKTDLLEYCIRNNIEVISSMGSGCRSNPTSLLITNITDVKYDPLASKIRMQLRKRGIDFNSSDITNTITDSDPMKPMVVNTSTGVYLPCISSYEKPVVKIMSYNESLSAKTSENNVMKAIPSDSTSTANVDSASMRYRCIPVYACVPVAFGNAICSYILHSIANKPYHTSVVVPLSQDVLMKMYNRLLTKEKNLYHNTELTIDRFDLYFLVQSIFKQKSIFSGLSIAGSKLEFTRWDKTKEPSLHNLVLGTAEECKQHDKEGLEGMDEADVMNDVMI